MEFLAILAVSAIAFASSLVFWKGAASLAEEFSVERTLSEISSSLSFHLSAFGQGRYRGSFSENFTIPPQARLNVFSAGDGLEISVCGRSTGRINSTRLLAEIDPFGERKGECESFPHSGRVTISGKSRGEGREIEVKISGID